MPKLDRDAVEAYCREATEGPWDRRFVNGDSWWLIYPNGDDFANLYPEYEPKAAEDSTFIANARTDLPLAVAELREQDALLQEAGDALEVMIDCKFPETGVCPGCRKGARAVLRKLGRE